MINEFGNVTQLSDHNLITGISHLAILWEEYVIHPNNRETFNSNFLKWFPQFLIIKVGGLYEAISKEGTQLQGTTKKRSG